MNLNLEPVAGGHYVAVDHAVTILVTRVSRRGKWADLVITPIGPGYSWRKRQRLVDGRFPFLVVEDDGRHPSAGGRLGGDEQ